jgi:energy-coupling factor transport system ATP-binding protein
LIEFRGFSFRYGDTDGYALKNINSRINDGEFLLVSGPSGSGKSSFCRCINGLIPHFYGGYVSGGVTVNSLDILKHTPRDLAPIVGMTFQDPENQLTATDVEREIVFGMENLGFDRRLMSKRLEESLDSIGIAYLRHRVIPELSGGEKQKVAIAAVLALHPRILIMDEPTSELDPKGAEDVLSIVQRLNDELGLTVILVEHRLERVIHLVDRVVIIHRGEIIADGHPRDILSERTPTEIGVGVPPLISLANRLRERGHPVDTIPLTVKEGRKIFDDAFKKGDIRLEKKASVPKNEAPPVIQVKNLWYVYAAGNTALRRVEVGFRVGELTAIMGRNASGKSTLLKHFNGLLKPTRGEVYVDGLNTKKASVAQLAGTVGLVFQNPDDHLFADTVEREIGMTLKNMGWPQDEIERRTEELLAQFGLERYRHRYPRYLSSGEKQRVALASVIAARPKILALDEPTRGMDYGLKKELMRFLRQYCAEGNTVILVSHDVETVAEHADRVILMSEGQIIVDGDRYEVLSEALLFSPQVNRLMQSFGAYGVPRDTLTVDEAIELLK